MANDTRRLLLAHCESYPELRAEDVFKLLYQSAFGCEHLVTNEAAALEYIKKEYATLPAGGEMRVEKLDGGYSRVYLSSIGCGLSPETLARLFCLSARKEADGKAELERKLGIAGEMVRSGELPISEEDYAKKLSRWREAGYPAIRHSQAFRDAYAPAYRVIADEFVRFLGLFAELDRRLAEKPTVLAIEGGSASGKTTLSAILKRVYACNVFHTDDFFLRPEQRTRERFAEIGGNLDRERFYEEIILPLTHGETVCYRRYDCSTQTLGDPIASPLTPLTVVEGVYSMHPELAAAYDLAVFLEISEKEQRARIEKRNPPPLAKRFFEEWIPLENRYFEGMRVRERCALTINNGK